MNEDYVSYELALKLKECGFDEPCIAEWACEPDGKPILLGSTAFVFSNAELKGRDVTAPLLYQAQKWLREKHDIHIQIEAVMQKQWTYTLVDTAPLSDMYGEWHDRIPEDREGYPQISTYEQALSDGIASALELIKKGE